MADKLPKDVADYFGLPEDATIDTLKANHSENYVKRSEAVKDDKIVSSVVGKTMGSERTAIRQKFKTMGVELEPKEVEGKNPSEVIELGLEKLGANFEASKKELQGQIGKGTDDAVKEYKEKVEKLEQKANDYKGKWEGLGKEFETFKATEKERVKKKDIESVFDKAFNNVPKQTNIDELKLKGFRAELKENYKIDLEEDGTPFITDLKGERIKNPNKAGATFTVEELFHHIAIEKNIVPKNDQQQKRVFNPDNYSNGNGGNKNEQPPTRKLSHKIKA